MNSKNNYNEKSPIIKNNTVKFFSIQKIFFYPKSKWDSNSKASLFMNAKTASIVLPPKTTVVQEGDESKGIYVIQDGKVELIKTVEGIEFQMGEISRGDIIGVGSVLSKGRHVITARTIIQTTALFYSNESIAPYFNDANPIISTFIKAVSDRLNHLSNLIVEARLKEKKLEMNTGNSHQHAGQLAYMLAAFVRMGTIEHDENQIYPLKSFLINAEHILTRPFDYLEKIFNAFSTSGLIKVIHDKKYGNIIMKPNVQLIEDFAVFSMSISKKGTAAFVPIKFHNWMSGLIRIHKRNRQNEGAFPKADFPATLGRELGRQDGEEIMYKLMGYKILSEKGADEKSKRIFFNAIQVQKRIIFESISRIVNDVSQGKVPGKQAEEKTEEKKTPE